mgnify:CR=1 FL=1
MFVLGAQVPHKFQHVFDGVELCGESVEFGLVAWESEEGGEPFAFLGVDLCQLVHEGGEFPLGGAWADDDGGVFVVVWFLVWCGFERWFFAADEVPGFVFVFTWFVVVGVCACSVDGAGVDACFLEFGPPAVSFDVLCGPFGDGRWLCIGHAEVVFDEVGFEVVGSALGCDDEVLTDFVGVGFHECFADDRDDGCVAGVAVEVHAHPSSHAVAGEPAVDVVLHMLVEGAGQFGLVEDLFVRLHGPAEDDAAVLCADEFDGVIGVVIF